MRNACETPPVKCPLMVQGMVQEFPRARPAAVPASVPMEIHTMDQGHEA